LAEDLQANRWEYFSLTDFKSAGLDLDFSEYYSEQNVRYCFPGDKIKISFQGVMKSGIENDKYRFGAIFQISNLIFSSWCKENNLIYFTNIHIVETDVNFKQLLFTQLEHVYKIQFFKNRLYLSGFLDHNFIFSDGRYNSMIVTEHQIGMKVKNSFFITSEFRFNDFLDKKIGVGFGFEFMIK
jgi:hypothetical protein